MINTINYKGRILFCDKRNVYKSVNRTILISTNSGRNWDPIHTLDSSLSKSRLLYLHSYFRRFFRYGIHHFHPGNGDNSCVLFDNKINIYNDNFNRSCGISGSRPLSLEQINDEFVFGEYRSNPERSRIRVFALNKIGRLYAKITMSGIRHIHGIYQDPYTNQVWITTGDENDEAAIFSVDPQFKDMKKILYGSQQVRAIKLLFTKEFIYFGTDAPNEINYIYRINKINLEMEKLTQVHSSVFHGCKVGNWLFFSTAIEPSKVNKSKHAEIWASPDGSIWKCILRFKKDFLPMKLFQYGQVFFPAGPGDEQNLWISPFATEYDNSYFKISLNEVNLMFNQN